MRFESVTIKDIAKALNLSSSTVSRALRDSYEISQETKQLVREYANSKNYRPNPIALSLKERKTRTIAIMVCEIANSFFSQVINGVEGVAYDRGYSIIISQSNESYDREVADLQNLSSKAIDGLIISVSTETSDFSHLEELHRRGLPIVLYDRITKNIDTHTVITDNYQGAFMATQHLLEMGYRRIAALASSEFLSITTDRLAGYRAALAKYPDVDPQGNVKHCYYGGMLFDEVDEAVEALWQQPEPPDAILCLNDKLTTNCLRKLKRMGVQVPEQVGLVGFSNSDLAELTDPALTIVRQPTFEIGRTAAELLLQTIESKKPVRQYEKRVLLPELIVGKSATPRR